MKNQDSKKSLMSAAQPKQRTVAFRALALLHGLGGSAFLWQLMPILAQQYRSIKKIRTSITQLEELHMVTMDDSDVVHITEIGRAHLPESEATKTTPPYIGKAAQARTVSAFKPMSVSAFSAMMSCGPQRPGMDDLRAMPSLMGGQRIVGGVRDE